MGNDDALVVLYEPSDPLHATVGLEDGCYNKSDDYHPDSFYIRTVQSAENVMVTRYKDELMLIHQDVLCGNGRVQTARHMLPGADDNLDAPWPDYLVLLMKDETLPPLMLIEDPRLTTAMYMTLATKSGTAENIPLEEMNKLKMIPGANPFNVWGMQTEAHALEHMLQVTGAKGLVLNTAGFYKDKQHNDRGEIEDIPKQLSLAIFPRIAKGLIRWHRWEQFPGTKIPSPRSFADIVPDFEAKYDPRHVRDPEDYRKLAIGRLEERLIFLTQLGIDSHFTNPLHKVMLRLHGEK
jgi:ATP-dependent phosphoenolpyruvate carboxykinase